MNHEARQSAAPSPAEQRVSVLVGDRLCTHCGYNLTGQAVLREGHYNMLIVRCPECSTVAAVQEYPLLGRWANRWAAALAAFWMLILLAMWIGSGAAIFGICVGAAEIASDTYNMDIYNRYNQWQSVAQQGPVQPGVAAPNAFDFGAWWKAQPRPHIFGSFADWRSVVDWNAFFLWIPLGLATLAFGWFWATALLGRKRGGLLLWALMVMLVAAAFCAIPISEWLDNDNMRPWRVGGRDIGLPVLLISLAFAGLMLSIGVVTGRSVVRGLIRLLLPPRLRSSLALLWTCDGLPAPSVGRLR